MAPIPLARRPLAALVLFLLAPPLAQAQALGETTFPTSGAPEAQGPFLRGLLLLHSFEYDDALDAFREAQRLDPDFAMAYWGEAMTHTHPIWMQQDRDAAVAALNRLAPTPEGRLALAPTPREKAYLDAVHTLYLSPGDKETRDDRYAEAMRQLAADFPDDLDAAAFSALAILGTAHEGRDVATYMRAAAVAEEVFAQNPRHPGAAHYLIHAYDDPAHAPLGLRAARVYSDLAPAASHALHMPSHIYVALGMWDETVDLNRRSYEAAKANSDRRGEPLNGHGWHALLWRTYAELQRGRFEEARRLLALGRVSHEAAPTGSSAHHVAMMRAYVMGEGADLPEADSAPVALDGLGETAAVATLFTDLRAALADGDAAGRDRLLDALRQRIDSAAGAASRATLHQAEGLVALAAGDTTAALAALREAAEIEDAMPVAFGPPVPVRPAHEALADALVEAGQYAEAFDEYGRALERSPGRRLVLLGRMRTGEMTRQTDAARAAQHALRTNLREADPAVRAEGAVEQEGGP